MMKRWLRKLRGALGIGAVWGAAGSLVGAIGGACMSLVAGVPLATSVLAVGAGAGVVAFLLGAGFAGVLSATEGRRTLEELSARRAAVWGAVVGAAGPVLVLVLHGALGWGGALSAQQFLPVVIGAAGSYAALTAALAAGTVSLAKRSPDALSAGAPDPARIGAEADSIG